jgi:hypothetical protein
MARSRVRDSGSENYNDNDTDITDYVNSGDITTRASLDSHGKAAKEKNGLQNGERWRCEQQEGKATVFTWINHVMQHHESRYAKGLSTACAHLQIHESSSSAPGHGYQPIPTRLRPADDVIIISVPSPKIFAELWSLLLGYTPVWTRCPCDP